MRAGLLAIAVVLLCAGPALAQKSKTPQAVAALEVCELFAGGNVLAVDDAAARGWNAYEQDSESPYVRRFTATRTLPGIGEADLFGLIEDYPQATFGYCRIDVLSPPVGKGEAQISAIEQLDRYEGTSQTIEGGTFASLRGTDTDNTTLLLAHWSEADFVLQLTTITPKPSPKP